MYQKGIDIFANSVSRILLEIPKSQIICVGPVNDLYGEFARNVLVVISGTKLFEGRISIKPHFFNVNKLEFDLWYVFLAPT